MHKNCIELINKIIDILDNVKCLKNTKPSSEVPVIVPDTKNPSEVPVIVPDTKIPSEVPVIVPDTKIPSEVPVIVPDTKEIKTSIKNWFKKEHWEAMFPYIKASSVFTHDNNSFWTYEDFLKSVDYMNNHPNEMYHNFASRENELSNKLELCAFLGNFHQETGEPSIEVPYPWYWPSIQKKPELEKYYGKAGGGLGICEGVIAEVNFSNTEETPTLPFPVDMVSKPIKLSKLEKDIIGCNEDYIFGTVRSLKQLNQPQFRIPSTKIYTDHINVGWDGQLYSKTLKNVSENIKDTLEINDTIEILNGNNFNSYGGRGAIQLSYPYNYTDCSLALFGDYRLSQYPNLITTTDRENLLGKPEYFGFPGPNKNGNNKLPLDILNTTPSARQLAFITCFWFWMDNNRSGRNVSCHNALQEYNSFRASCLIINNDDGTKPGSWASKKVEYYKRMAKILEIPDQEVEKTLGIPLKKFYL